MKTVKLIVFMVLCCVASSIGRWTEDEDEGYGGMREFEKDSGTKEDYFDDSNDPAFDREDEDDEDEGDLSYLSDIEDEEYDDRRIDDEDKDEMGKPIESVNAEMGVPKENTNFEIPELSGLTGLPEGGTIDLNITNIGSMNDQQDGVNGNSSTGPSSPVNVSTTASPGSSSSPSNAPFTASSSTQAQSSGPPSTSRPTGPPSTSRPTGGTSSYRRRYLRYLRRKAIRRLRYNIRKLMVTRRAILDGLKYQYAALKRYYPLQYAIMERRRLLRYVSGALRKNLYVLKKLTGPSSQNDMARLSSLDHLHDVERLSSLDDQHDVARYRDGFGNSRSLVVYSIKALKYKISQLVVMRYRIYHDLKKQYVLLRRYFPLQYSITQHEQMLKVIGMEIRKDMRMMRTLVSRNYRNRRN